MIAAMVLGSALAFASVARTEPRFIVMHARINAYGVPGTGTIALDRLTGRFVRKFDAGPASEQEGFDGTRTWRADATGMARVQTNSGERGEIKGWASALARATKSVTPHAQVTGSTDRVDIAFDAYRTFGSLLLPGRIVATSQQNGVWTATILSVQTPATVANGFFNPPEDAVRDFALDRTTRIPVSMSGGPPAFQVRVNGHAFTFILDTGGQNVITRDAAKIAGLRVVGKGSVGGGGGGTAPISYATAQTVRAGAALMRHQPFIVLPTGSFGNFDGIVGYELLSRFAARLDMAHGVLELAANPSAFGAARRPVPFGYDDRQPQIDGALDGIPGAFTIDTGSNLTAQIQAPFVRSHDLVTRLHATVVAYALDVGGRYPLYLVRAHSMRLGSVEVADPLVTLLTRAGSTHSTSTIANVGDGILRRWIIVFDYPHNRIDFRPGGDASGNTIRDRSGLVLRAKDNALVVAEVLGGTPAAKAGLAEGALIVAVNGNAVNATDLDRVRATLRGAPGTLVRLQLSDKSVRTLRLQKYL